MLQTSQKAVFLGVFSILISQKVPFATIIDKEMIAESFNSNFSSACQLYLPSDIKENKGKCFFIYNESDNTKGFYKNILKKDDNEFEKLSIELNLSTIEIKSFKLKQNLTKCNTLSIFRTNISYINANHQNLETLLVNHLDHKFDVIQ